MLQEEICIVMKGYERYHRTLILKRWDDFKSVLTTSNGPSETLATLYASIQPTFASKISSALKALKTNQMFFDNIVTSLQDSGVFDVDQPIDSNILKVKDLHTKMESLRSTLKQVAREWSADGAEEREFHKLILREICAQLPLGSKVLVPGAGLGRLSYEIALEGYETEACEFSLFVLYSSYFIMNRCGTETKICPYVFPFSNCARVDEQMRLIPIPDLALSKPSSNFSMVAGDFLDVYKDPSYVCSYDCVLSCFFLDTAKNVLEYLVLIQAILKHGGLWINFGPLQWHWEDNLGEPSIELTREEVYSVARSLNLQLLKSQLITAAYSTDPKSLSQPKYICDFSVWKNSAGDS